MMKKLSILAIALLSVATVSARYAPNYGSTINLGGSTLAAPYMNAAITLYNSIFPCPVFVYKQSTGFTGSGAGRADVYNGTLTASVSDSAAPLTETANLPDCFLQIPFILSSVSIIMNPPSTVVDSTGCTWTVNKSDIRLTGADLCAIFTATSPTDPAVQWETYFAKPYNNATAVTPSATCTVMPYTAPILPADYTQIKTFARSDSSGTSAIFTTYLNMCGGCTSVMPNDSTVFGNPPVTPSTVFPLATPENGTPAMLAAVQSTADSMGYAGTGDNLGQSVPSPFALLLEANGVTTDLADFLSPEVNTNISNAQVGNPSCTNLVCQPNAYPMVQAELFDVFGTQTTEWISCNISQFILFLLTQGQKLGVPGFVNMTTECLSASLIFLDSIAPAICNPCIPPCIPCQSPTVCPSLPCPSCQI